MVGSLIVMRVESQLSVKEAPLLRLREMAMCKEPRERRSYQCNPSQLDAGQLGGVNLMY